MLPFRSAHVTWNNPHDAELLRLRAECYVRMGDMAKAIADETTIVKIIRPTSRP